MQLQEKRLYLLRGQFALFDLEAGIERDKLVKEVKLGLEMERGIFERENDGRVLMGFWEWKQRVAVETYVCGVFDFDDKEKANISLSVAAVMGVRSSFDDNAVEIVDKQGQPKGSRVFGTVPHELRKKRHVKILAMAEHIA
ncbi:hypothetical protein SADUNF_Sadunf03G0068200 [Salix dunnii]|uniref:Uncharacterized protein n=1 Tax=Salix dunnii TaxID=1413687 RepID=A0A835KA93_9ROSI|nr:hypothetical protein SADUNF_Sadunf03G0068200 [Salix dunnii]